MHEVLVTGATGCLGRHLVEILVEHGFCVRALVRDAGLARALEGPRVSLLTGDVRDLQSLKKAANGCRYVFHTAALISTWEAHRAHVWEVNVQGTARVVQACLEARVERLIHTSSAAAIGYSPAADVLVDETSPWNFSGPGFLYQESKRAAEQEVLRGCELGLNATLCNPSLMFGAYDRAEHAARLLRMARRGLLFAYPPGGMAVANVVDVARGHLQAAQLGISGERYIMSGENLSFKALFARIQRCVGGIGPQLPLPAPLWTGLARLLAQVGQQVGWEPSFTPARAHVLTTHQFLSDERARRELGYRSQPIDIGIRAAAEWLER